MKIHLFFNPAAAAGKSAMRLGATLANFRKLGASVELRRPASARAARSEMRELAGKVDRIVVVGGDGMVHQAANALVGTSTVLGIVCAGTGNDAAKSLGLGDEVEQSCKAALRDPVAIDLVSTNDGVAVTVATAGFSGSVTARANEMKLIKGGAKYTASSLIELPKLRPHDMTMTLDGQVHQIEANLIAVANTQYFGGGMKIAPDAVLNNGMLDVVVIGPASRLTFAAVLPAVFSGRHVKSRLVKVHRATTVVLDGAEMNLWADGEPFGALPTSLTVLPQSLLVAGAVV